ncbi:Solute carrier family 35 protein [Spironucleus salmonicida]|uniref:Solute carrier family 35 protein n=1 Tax=Spironucleus salmonicida TaxID=348837 RepID=V6LJT7_9EUKA|nr:Solute carrier family 35 protein [Spironucleus salmonicida]|eukprot:EST44792.1 Transmembrane domain-containing protein [Spironucleus salmonicida]
MRFAQTAVTFLLGLILAILNSSLGIIQKQVDTSYSLSMPFFSTLTFYFFQAILVVFPSSHKHWKQCIFPLLNGVVDFAGTACIVYAFPLTSVSSVSLFQTLAMPASLIFSLCIIKNRFTALHIVAVLLAMGFSAGFAGTDYSGTKLTGSILGILGAFLFGLSSVMMQKFGSQMSTFEYMSKMGLSGVLLSVVLCVSLETSLFVAANAGGIGLLVLYGIIAAFYIFLGLYVIGRSNAVFFMMCSVLVPVFTFPVDVLHFKSKFVWWQILIGFGMLGSVVLYIVAEWLGEKKQQNVVPTDPDTVCISEQANGSCQIGNTEA